MLKIANLIVIIMLFPVFPAWTQAHDPVQPPGATTEERKPAEGAVKHACDCCRLCMAAQKPVVPDKEGPPATGGCGDCCERCGRVDHPLKKTTPPEIMKEKPAK